MSLTVIKILMAVACAGHILCCFCDRAITYTPNGRFNFGDLKNNEKLSALFEGAPLKNQLFSMLAGVLALTMSSLGYIALYEYVGGYSTVCGTIMLISLVLFMVSGTAHHVFCGVTEWFYIRLGRTEEARQAILDFFKKTISTMYVCYVGLLAFSITLFVAIVSGTTGLPRWACVFNVQILFIALFPLRIVGSFNIASAASFLGLLITLCVAC